MKFIAIIRIVGQVGVNKPIKDTLSMLRLYKKHSCVIVPNNPSYLGMLKKIKDYVTWGEVDESMIKELLLKRGKLHAKKNLTEEFLKENLKMDIDTFVKKFCTGEIKFTDVPGLKPFFKLSPPAKGFERGGTKKPYSMGGVLGYRKEKINDLIKRML